MHPYIQEMLVALKPWLRDGAGAKRALDRYWRDKIAIVWKVEDVYRAANERRLALSEEEAVGVLEHLATLHNPQLGLKWEDLYHRIEERCLGRELTRSELKRFLEKNVLIVQH